MNQTFKWLNISQFTGAFNDNAFKMTAVIVLAKLLGQENLPTVLAICSALFVTPFLLFSNLAGTLADRFSKRNIIIASKWMEVVLLIIAIPTLLAPVAWGNGRRSGQRQASRVRRANGDGRLVADRHWPLHSTATCLIRDVRKRAVG